jgi:hypothetical protein|tara:strand:- start:907 stop:1113 length:207 start_codon:yes stop_codon:yes gene_type:complete
MIEVNITLSRDSPEGEINTRKSFEGENVKDILSFLVKVLDFSQFELRSKVIEVDYLGNVVSIEHRGKK